MNGRSIKRRFKQLVKLFKVLSNRDYLYALKSGVVAAVEHESILKNISYATVLDVGANKGQFSLVAKSVRPECKVIAFEPLACPASKYRSVFFSNNKLRSDVILHNVAIGPEYGETDIYVSKRDDSSSLLPITQMQEEQFPGTGLERVEKIKVRRLDSCISENALKRPVLLKLDVQGYELEALKGCDSLLDRIDHVLAECSFVELYEGQAMAHQVITYLQEAGFDLFGVYNISFDREGMPVQADFFFVQDQQRRPTA